jgi:hypothetical protein
VPSFEGFSFRAEHPEGGDQFLIGKRLKPFGFDWLADGRNPYNELPIRVNRIAYREFTHDPDLDYAEFERRLGAELFGSASDATKIDDALFLQESLFADRSWFSASPMISPLLLNAKLEMGVLSLDQLAMYRDRLERVEQIAERYHGVMDPASREMYQIAGWVAQSWVGKKSLLLDHLR